MELNVDYWSKRREREKEKEEQSALKAAFSRVSVSRIGKSAQNPNLLNAIGNSVFASSPAAAFAPSPAPPSSSIQGSSQSLPISYPCLYLTMTYYKDRRQLMRLPKRTSEKEKEKEKEKDRSHSKAFVVTKMICSASDPNAVLTVSIDSVEFIGSFSLSLFLFHTHTPTLTCY